MDEISDLVVADSADKRYMVEYLPDWVVEELVTAIRAHVDKYEMWIDEEWRLLWLWLEYPCPMYVCAAAHLAKFDLEAFLEAPLD